MIPVSLTIKGLYSYQQEQVIDFTKLTEAQLFGIFGTVGSGKSSILEAISFALYSDTERLNKSGDNRNYNMLNLKSNELLLDFTFLNHNKQLYHFVVKGRRNGNNFDNVGTFQRFAYKLNGVISEPLADTTAESIIGLSYENFRRTIIIPQGKFQEFLQLGDTARTNMLKEIFHLEKFEFYQQTLSLEKKNEAQLQQYSGQLIQLEHVSDEIVKEKVDEVQKLNETHKTYLVSLQNLEKEEAELIALKKQVEERAEKLLSLEKLNERKPNIDSLDKQVEQFEFCMQHFKGLYDQENNATRSRNLKQEILNKASEALKIITTHLEQDEPKLKLLSGDFNKLDLRKKEKEEYLSLFQIKQIEKNTLELDLKKQSLSVEVTEAEKAKLEISKKITEQKGLIKSLKEKLPDFQELSLVQSWFTKQETLNKNLSNEQINLSSIIGVFENQQAQLNSHISSSLIEKFPFTPDITVENYISQIQKHGENIQTELQELQKQREHLSLQSKLTAYTEQIKEGNPCPLCGSHEHPEILQIENVEVGIEKIDFNLQKLYEESQAITITIRELGIASARLEELKNQVKITKDKLDLIKKEVLQHQTTFTWKGFSQDKPDQFKTAQQQAIDHQKEIQSLEVILTGLEKDFETASGNFDRKKLEFDQVETEIKIQQGQQSTLKQQIQSLDKTVYVMDEITIQEKIEELKQHITETESHYTTLTDRITRNNLLKVTEETNIKVSKADIEQLDRELVELAAKIKEVLGKSEFTTIEETKFVLANELDLPNLKREVSDFRNLLFSLQQDLAVLEKTLEGKFFNEQRYNEVNAHLQQLRPQIEEHNRALIEAETVLSKLKIDLASKQEVLLKSAKLTLRKNNLQALKRLFMSSGFVNYISTVYLQQLCEVANERFYKLTKQQLRLEITEGNNFQVRDFLHEGRVRSIKTLSGGQSFQASLCLALALAESIPQQSQANQNFFFLDEGFGSQDKESLRIVFESLKALRQENRIVGVISHVEELQQEIDTYLTITNDPEKGSLVVGSWK